MFYPENFIKNLPYMGKGMLGIMAVIAVIIVITAILNKITGEKK